MENLGRYIVFLVFSMVIGGSIVPAAAQLPDESAWRVAKDERQFVEGLVERRLFTLAERACRNWLETAQLTPRRQVEWTVELIRIYGEHAAHSVPGRREDLWDAAHEVAEDFAREHPDHPRGILVAVQNALTYLAAGKLARLEAEVAADPRQAVVRARKTIRTASEELETLADEVTEKLAMLGGRSARPGELSEDELFSLQNNLRFQLARARSNQGLCYPPESEDRVAALSAAVKQLNATLTQLQPTDSLAGKAYLELARCHRWLGDFAQAKRSLESALSESATDDLRRDATAEQARLLVAEDRSSEALEMLKQARGELSNPSAELDFAQLEAMLALWKEATEGEDEEWAGEWQERVAAAVAAIERRHGAYWGRRAKLGQLAVARSGAASGSVDILAATADEQYRKEEYDEAISTYQKGADLARAGGDLAVAGKLEYKAALVEQELQRHAAAARRLQRLALEQPTAQDASQRHLLACWNAAQAVRAGAMPASRYRELLEEHLAEWPAQQPANRIRQWLGSLAASRQEWEAAINAYRGIRPDSELFPSAVDSLHMCWTRWLEEQRAAGDPSESIVADATDFFDGVILGPEPNRRWPERWSPAQRAAALATARLRIDFSPDDLDNAQRVLEAALQGVAADAEDFLREARLLLLVAVAAQPGQQQQALEMLPSAERDSAEQLFSVIDKLERLIAQSTPNARQQLAAVQLAVCRRLEASREELSESQRQRIARLRADSLQVTGKTAAARKIYQRLAAEQPDSGQVQLKYAELLLQSDDPEMLSKALSQWQSVARRLRPGTEAWFRARYSIALALYKRNRPAGNKRESDRQLAAQQLRYLQATSSVGQTPWGEKVRELLAECE